VVTGKLESNFAEGHERTQEMLENL
jgi:hypothetical protein